MRMEINETLQQHPSSTKCIYPRRSNLRGARNLLPDPEGVTNARINYPPIPLPVFRSGVAIHAANHPFREEILFEN